MLHSRAKLKISNNEEVTIRLVSKRRITVITPKLQSER